MIGNSKTWRRKADDLWAFKVKEAAGFQCEICWKQGRYTAKWDAPTGGLHAHHLVERGQYGYRYDLDNGICVCVSCHGSHPQYRNRLRNFHGSDEQREAASDALEKFCPDKWAQWQVNKGIKKRLDGVSHQAHYERLRGDR